MSGESYRDMRLPPPPSQPPAGHDYISGQEGNAGYCQPNVHPHPYTNPPFPGHNSGPRSFPAHAGNPHNLQAPPPNLHNNPPPGFHRPPLPPPRFGQPPPANIPYQDTFQSPPMMVPREYSPMWHQTPPPPPGPQFPQVQARGPTAFAKPGITEGTAMRTTGHREEEDAKWLDEFEKRVKSCPAPPPPSPPKDCTKKVKLGEVQRMVFECYSLREELCGLEKQLTEASSSAEEEKWDELVQQTEKTKGKLNQILEIFQDPQFIKHTKALLKQRRAKRNRVKRRKQKKRMEKEELQTKRKEEEDKIDAWRAKIKREEDSKRQEEAVKREADSVLGEVRQKRNEGQKMVQLLEALGGLRHTRAVQAMAQGQSRDTEAEQRFTNTTKMLAEIVKEQLKEYELEEQTLRVMMEESASHRSAALTAKRDANFVRYEDSIRKLLFGLNTAADAPQDAELTLETLVQRRREWDQFVVDEDNPLASSVPLSWVLPPTQPESSWAAFLKR